MERGNEVATVNFNDMEAVRSLHPDHRKKMIGRLAVDKHHIFHNRQEWELRPESAAIRNFGAFVVDLVREGHNVIHDECPVVPPLNHFQLNSLRAVMRKNEALRPGPLEDPIVAIDKISWAIEDAANRERAHELEKMSAGLTVEAVRAQIPYIKDFMVIGG